MKIHQATLLFVCLFIICIVLSDVRVGKVNAALNEKEEISHVIKAALDDAIKVLAGRESDKNIKSDREEAIDKFFLSLYSNMGIIMDYDQREQVELYIPVIVISDIDGFYLYYYQEYIDETGSSYYERAWTEKQPYSYEDENFIYSFSLNNIIKLYDKRKIMDGENELYEIDYSNLLEEQYLREKLNSVSGISFLNSDKEYEEMKKKVIMDCIQNKMSYYISEHNQVASQHGITYQFHMPAYDKDGSWASYMDDVNMAVVFQGYSYGYDIYTYNDILSSAANILKKEDYIIEEKSWYKIYHKSSCSEIKLEEYDEKYYDEKECIEQGAYACEKCIINGAVAPEIK